MKNDSHAAGVYPARKKNGTEYFRASVTYHGKHISLGSYPSEKDAHTAYLESKKIFHSRSIKISDYPLHRYHIIFEKYVSVINLRDNGIYFSNPLYLYKKYFEYYLSPDTVLKFDMDDLFYYSSHKISQRKGHFFVADYGMQYNIKNRYGIKNYAVLNRDYSFSNSDPLDFRYENIQIINTFHGVSQIKKSNKFKASIHINGNYKIGEYDSPVEAAIAYNKAIDILASSGVHKNYSENFIENLSAREYAEIYLNTPVSEKIKNYGLK